MNHHIATGSLMTETHRSIEAPARPFFGLAVLSCLALGIGLSGCSSINTSSLNTSNINPVNWITPYRVDIIQGNFLSKEQVDMLKTGMTRAQVKDLLGTPLVSSLFHQNRWDYVFTLRRQGVEPQSFKYTVYFKGDELERFEGDTMPTEADFIATLAPVRKFAKAFPLEATEEQLKSAEKPTDSKAATSAAGNTGAGAPVPATVYPPLEGATR
ncbi:MAG: outer membrane protein assembly factor BamE [Polaromonas sp.]|nr:outer membrane protein assembly factor BamE [Polaromonas sp.]